MEYDPEVTYSSAWTTMRIQEIEKRSTIHRAIFLKLDSCSCEASSSFKSGEEAEEASVN